MAKKNGTVSDNDTKLKVRLWMAENGVSIGEMADHFGISRNTMQGRLIENEIKGSSPFQKLEIEKLKQLGVL